MSPRSPEELIALLKRLPNSVSREESTSDVSVRFYQALRWNLDQIRDVITSRIMQYPTDQALIDRLINISTQRRICSPRCRTTRGRRCCARYCWWPITTRTTWDSSSPSGGCSVPGTTRLDPDRVLLRYADLIGTENDAAILETAQGCNRALERTVLLKGGLQPPPDGPGPKAVLVQPFSKDYEGSESWIYIAMINLMLRRLNSV